MLREYHRVYAASVIVGELVVDGFGAVARSEHLIQVADPDPMQRAIRIVPLLSGSLSRFQPLSALEIKSLLVYVPSSSSISNHICTERCSEYRYSFATFL